MATGGQNLHILHPRLAQPIRHPFRRLLHVFGVFGQRRNAGDAQKIEQFTIEALLILRQIILPV